MADWVCNKIAVRGNKSTLIAWLNKGLTNDKRDKLTLDMSCEDIARVLNEKYLSLESFIPMPQTFYDYDTTNSVHSVSNWLNGLLLYGAANKKIQKHFNKWLYGYFEYDNTKMNFVGINRLKKIAFKRGIAFPLLTQEYIINVAEKDEQLMKLILKEYNVYVAQYNAAKEYQQETYGLVGWYNWRHKYLGCKWNEDFYNVVVKDLGNNISVVYFVCDTPWNIPTEWLKTMQEENKENGLVFYCRSDEESGLWNGYFCCLESGWREDHEYSEVYDKDNDDDELIKDRWEKLCTTIDQRFEDDVECMFETIEME